MTFFFGFVRFLLSSVGRLRKAWLTFSLAYSKPTSTQQFVWGSFKRNLYNFNVWLREPLSVENTKIPRRCTLT